MLRTLTRTLPVALRAQMSRREGPISVIHRRVLLSEIDTNLHMNQAVYAEVFELGRVDWMVGTRTWRDWRTQGINPVVGSQKITYRRELKPLQRYRVETRTSGQHGRLVNVQGVIAVGDVVHALAEVGLLLLGPDGVLDSASVTEALVGRTTPPLAIEDWRLV